MSPCHAGCYKSDVVVMSVNMVIASDLIARSASAQQAPSVRSIVGNPRALRVSNPPVSA